MLVDTHCHLFMPPLRDDLEAVLRRARGAGVGEIVVPAFDLESWDSISAMSAHPMIHTALGLHPWKAEQVLDRDDLAAVLTSTGSVAIGEIGLDFKVSEAGRERQMLVLSTQLDLALELDLPVILHCRGAFQ